MDSLAICFREDDSWKLSEPGQEMLADEKELYRDSGDKGLTEKQKLRQQKRERLRREQLKEVQISITGQKGPETSLAEKDGNLLDLLRERLTEPDAQDLIHDWAENDLHLLPGGDSKLSAKVMALLVGADPHDKQVLDKIAGMDLRETKSELENTLHVALREARVIHTGSRDGQWLRGQLAQLASHWPDAAKWAVDAVGTTSIKQLVTSNGPVIDIPALQLIGQSGAVPVASLIFNTLYLVQTACNMKKHGISKAIDQDLSQRLEGTLKMLLTRGVHMALGSVGQKVCELANYMVGVVTQQGIPAVEQAVPQQPQALNQTQEAGCPTPASPDSSIMVLNLSGQTLNGQGVKGQPLVFKDQSFETLSPVHTVCPATSDDTLVAEGEVVDRCEAFESIDMKQHMVTDQNGQTLIRTRGEVHGFAGVFNHDDNKGAGYKQTQVVAGTPGPGVQKPTPLHRVPTRNSTPDEAAAEAESKIIYAKPMVQGALRRVNGPGGSPDSALNNVKAVRQETSFASSPISMPEKAIKVVGSAFTGALTGMALTGGPWGLGVGMVAGIANALLPGTDARPVDPLPARDAGENSVASIAAQDGKVPAGMAALPQSTSTVPTHTTGAPSPTSPEGVFSRGIATVQANCMDDTELCRSVGSRFQQQNALELMQRDIERIERLPDNPDYTEMIHLAALQSGIAAPEVHENLWKRDDFRQHIAIQLVKGEYPDYPLPGLNGTPEDVLKRAAAAESAIKTNNYYSFPEDTTAASAVDLRKYGLFASYIQDYQLLFRLRESEPVVQTLVANIQKNDETLKNLTTDQLWQNPDFASQMMGEITSGTIKLNGAELTGSYNTLKTLLTGIKHPVSRAKPFPPGVPLPIAEPNNLIEVYTRIFPLDLSPEAFGEYLAREFPGEVGDPTEPYIQVVPNGELQGNDKRTLISLVDRLKTPANKQLYKYPSESAWRGPNWYSEYSEDLLQGIKAYSIANASGHKAIAEPHPAQGEKEIHIHQQTMLAAQALYNHSPLVKSRQEALQWAQAFIPSSALIDVFSNLGDGWIDKFAHFYDNKMGGEKLSHQEVNDLLLSASFPMPDFVKNTGGEIVREVYPGLNSRLMMPDLLHLHPKEMAEILHNHYPDFTPSTLEPLLNAKPDSISWPTEMTANPELQQKISQYISASLKQRIDARDHYQQLVMVALESTISAAPVLKKMVSDTLQRIGIDADPDTKITLEIDATSYLPDIMENDLLYGSSRQQIDTTIGGLVLGTFRQPFRGNLGFRRKIIDFVAHHKPTILAIRLNTDAFQPVSNHCISTTPAPVNGTDLAQQLFDNREALTVDVDINKYALSKLSFIMNPESRKVLINDKVRVTRDGLERLTDDIKARKVVIRGDTAQALKKLKALRHGQEVEHGTFFAKSRGGNYPAGNMLWVKLSSTQYAIISQRTGQTMIASPHDLNNLGAGKINDVSSELFTFVTSHLDLKQLFDATLKKQSLLEKAYDQHRHSIAIAEKPDKMVEGLRKLRKIEELIRAKFPDRIGCDAVLNQALSEMWRDEKALERVLPFWMAIYTEDGSEIKLELGQNEGKRQTLEQTSHENVLWDAVSHARTLDHKTNTAAELSEEQWHETLLALASITVSMATAGAASSIAAAAHLGRKAILLVHMAMQMSVAGAEQTLRAVAQANEAQRQAEFIGIPLAMFTSLLTDVVADTIAPAVLKQLKHAWRTTKNINVLKTILANHRKQVMPDLVALERQWGNLSPSHKTELLVDALMETGAAHNRMASGSSRSSLVGQISEKVAEHRQLRGAMQESSFYDEYMAGYLALDEIPPLVAFDGHTQAPASTAYRTPDALVGSGERYRLNENTLMQDYPVPPNGVYEQYYKQAENNVAAYQRLYGADAAKLHRYFDNWEQRISAQLPDLPGESMTRLLNDESVGLEAIVFLEELRPARQTEAITALVDELDRKGIYHPDITLDNLHYDFAQKKLMLENFDQAQLLPEGSTLSAAQRDTMQQQLSEALSSAMKIKQRVIDDMLFANRKMDLDDSPTLSQLATHGNIQQIREVYEKIQRSVNGRDLYTELADSYRKRYGDNLTFEQEVTIHYEQGNNGEVVLSLRREGDGPPQPDAKAPAIAETSDTSLTDKVKYKTFSGLREIARSLENVPQLLTNLLDADFKKFAQLQKNARSMIQFNPSERPQKFITELLKKSGIITEAERKENRHLIKQALAKDITYDKLMPDAVEIQTRQQLINTPPGEVVVFTNNFNMVEGIMVSHGNGRFSGADLDKLEGTLGSGVQMVAAENFDDFIDGLVNTKLGGLTLHRGGIGKSPTNRNPQFTTNLLPERIVQLAGEGGKISINLKLTNGKPDPTSYTVKYSMHGAPGTSFDRQLAEENANIVRAMIKLEGYNVEHLQKMNFVSCYSAVGGNIASNGQSMANELGVPVIGYKSPITWIDADDLDFQVSFKPMSSATQKTIVKNTNHLLHGVMEMLRDARHALSRETGASRTKRAAETALAKSEAISDEARAKIQRIASELPRWLNDEAFEWEGLIRVLADRELAYELGLGEVPPMDTTEMEMARNMVAGAKRVMLRQDMMKAGCDGSGSCDGLTDTIATAIHEHRTTQMMDNISRVVSKTDQAQSAVFNKRIRLLNSHAPYAMGMKEMLLIGTGAHARSAWKQSEVMDSLRSSVGATAYQLKTEQHSVLIGKSADQNDNTFWYLVDPRVGMAEYETPEALDTALGQTIFNENVARLNGASWVGSDGTTHSSLDEEGFAPPDTEPAYNLLKLNTTRIAEYELPGMNGCKVKDLSQPNLPATLTAVQGADGRLRLVDENATAPMGAIRHVPGYHGSKKTQMASLDRPDVQTNWKAVADGLQSKKVVKVLSIDEQLSANWHPQGNQAQALQHILHGYGIEYVAKPQNFIPQNYRFPENVDVTQLAADANEQIRLDQLDSLAEEINAFRTQHAGTDNLIAIQGARGDDRVGMVKVAAEMKKRFDANKDVNLEDVLHGRKNTEVNTRLSDDFKQEQYTDNACYNLVKIAINNVRGTGHPTAVATPAEVRELNALLELWVTRAAVNR